MCVCVLGGREREGGGSKSPEGWGGEGGGRERRVRRRGVYLGIRASQLPGQHQLPVRRWCRWWCALGGGSGGGGASSESTTSARLPDFTPLRYTCDVYLYIHSHCGATRLDDLVGLYRQSGGRVWGWVSSTTTTTTALVTHHSHTP